jgi:hypothetical protein
MTMTTKSFNAAVDGSTGEVVEIQKANPNQVLTIADVLPEFKGLPTANVGGVILQSGLDIANYLRVDWDKRAAVWVHSAYEDEQLTDLDARLIAAVLLYVKWSDVVGKPLCMDVGQPCDGYPHDQGIRLYFDDTYLGQCTYDAFGLTYRFAQGVIKEAGNNGGLFAVKGSKIINTKNGQFYVPSIARNRRVDA